MLIAHAPAGYLLTRIITRLFLRDTVIPERSDPVYRKLMIGGIIGGILPDFDFIYHIFIDSDRTSHHGYWTHMPFFWLAVWLMCFAAGRLSKNGTFTAIISVTCLSALLHLVCDTLTGVIYWFYPFSDRGVNVFRVADMHVWWVRNYIHHWTFLVEIGITAAAMIVFLRIREVVTELTLLFRRNEKIRSLVLRLAICGAGIAVIVFVGSMRFDIDNRFVKKIRQLKHHIVQMVRSS